MLKKPLPGSARLMLGAGLAVLASSATAAVMWQQQPATVISLPAVAVAAATAPLPPLAVQGQVHVPAPSALPSVALVAVAAAPVAPSPSATPVTAAAPVAAPRPVPATQAVAPVAAPASPVATPAPKAPAAPAASGVTLSERGSPQRAPLEDPLYPQRIYAYSDNLPLPPPPMPTEDSGQLEVTEPKVVLVDGANPAADAAGYQPPRIRLAKPARLPFLASARPETLVAYGMVMKVKVGTNGKPLDAKVHDSKLSAVYERNALAAVKRWRFEPASLAGQPQEATVLVPVWFTGTSVSNFESEALRHPRPQYRMPQAVAGQ